MSFSACSYHSSFHHIEALPEAPSFQMGQPSEALRQRQQADDLPAYQGDGDGHGVERELQFSDPGCRQIQAQG